MAEARLQVVVEGKGQREIERLTKGLKGIGDQADTTQKKLEQAFSKSGQEIKTAANGMRYFTDAAGRARKVNGQFVTTAGKSCCGIR